MERNKKKRKQGLVVKIEDYMDRGCIGRVVVMTQVRATGVVKEEKKAEGGTWILLKKRKVN